MTAQFLTINMFPEFVVFRVLMTSHIELLYYGMIYHICWIRKEIK